MMEELRVVLNTVGVNVETILAFMSVGFIVSEGLSYIPGIKANGVLQAVNNILHKLLKK